MTSSSRKTRKIYLVRHGEPDFGSGGSILSNGGTGCGIRVTGFDAAAPGFDASAPGFDASAPGYNAAAPGYNAAAPGFDAAAPGCGINVTGSRASERRCIGLSDPPLSDRGMRQAGDLSRYFSGKDISVVYHSRLMRAKQTAEILSNGVACRAIQADGLEEIDMGEWEGLTFKDIYVKYPDLYEKRGTEIASLAPPGGETFMQALARFSSAVARIAGADTGADACEGADTAAVARSAYEARGDIAIVAHAGVNRIFLCEILGIDYNKVLSVPQPYGCINILQYTANGTEGGGFRAVSYGAMPFEPPGESECYCLLNQYGTPDAVVAHCGAVARKAVQIAGGLDEKSRSGIDLELVKSAALLHDIARAEKAHAEAGYRHLLKCGYPRVAKVIRSHHGLDPEDLESITESTIVFYADKLVSGAEEISLDERFERSRALCHTPGAVRSHMMQYEQAIQARVLINLHSV